jgi:hypothetical protein
LKLTEDRQKFRSKQILDKLRRNTCTTHIDLGLRVGPALQKQTREVGQFSCNSMQQRRPSGLFRSKTTIKLTSKNANEIHENLPTDISSQRMRYSIARSAESIGNAKYQRMELITMADAAVIKNCKSKLVSTKQYYLLRCIRI